MTTNKKIESIVFKTELDQYDTPNDVADPSLMSKERLDSFGEEWQYMNTYAEARVLVVAGHSSNNEKVYQIHRITGGHLTGVESDSSEEYLTELKMEAYEELKTQLKAFGFTDKQIRKHYQKYIQSQDLRG